MKKKIAIVNYGLGNYGSIIGTLDELGHDTIVSNSKKELDSCDLLILPGVGTFPKAIKELKRSNLLKYLKKVAKKGKAILGICLGMQLLTNSSDELKYTEGLKIIPGNIQLIKSKNHHIGWNNLNFLNKSSEFRYLKNKYLYFQHQYSYYGPKKFQIANVKNFQATTAIIKKENVLGVQFHPEKSQDAGSEFFKKYIEMI
tara:strand:- start:610 stop:1209 length:600 start_codon:yes stop_codon:yes gene_type:complete